MTMTCCHLPCVQAENAIWTPAANMLTPALGVASPRLKRASQILYIAAVLTAGYFVADFGIEEVDTFPADGAIPADGGVPEDIPDDSFPGKERELILRVELV